MVAGWWLTIVEMVLGVGLLIVVVVMGIMSWLLWGYRVKRVWRWVVDAPDRVLYWGMDKVLGKHAEIEKEEENGVQ